MPRSGAPSPDAACPVAPIFHYGCSLRPRLAARGIRLAAGDHPGMSSGRRRRVNEAIRQVLSDALPTLKDPRIGFVTVTGVEATTDLKQATVWVSVLGSEQERAITLEGLQAAHGVLQARVARELRLRRTPVLAFKYDPTVERGVRLTRMIDELAPEAPDVEDRD